MRNTETSSVCYNHNTWNEYMYGILLLTSICLNCYILWKTRHELICWLRIHYAVVRNCGGYRLFQILINTPKKRRSHETIDTLQRENRRLMATVEIHMQNLQANKSEIDRLEIIIDDLIEKNRALNKKAYENELERRNLLDHIENQKNEMSTILNGVLILNNHQRWSQSELNATKAKMKDLEQTLQQYENTITEMQSTNKTGPAKETIRECSICLEEYSQDRKQVAFSPCGHAPSCEQCAKSDNFVRKCPICRTKIKRAVILEGIY